MSWSQLCHGFGLWRNPPTFAPGSDHVSPRAMYHGCISPVRTGLCRSVRPVSVCAPITPARSIHSNTDPHRPTHTDTPVFQIWEQEAGSSNLPTPTTSDRVRAGGVSRMYQTSARFLTAIRVSDSQQAVKVRRLEAVSATERAEFNDAYVAGRSGPPGGRTAIRSDGDHV